MMRILIIKLGAVGDVIHSLPVARTLRCAFPDCHLAWAVEEKAQAVLTGNPDLSEILLFERRQIVKRSGLGVLSKWAGRLRAGRFDVVIDLHQLLKTGLMALASRAPRRIGFDKWREGNRLFMTETIRPDPRHRHAVEKYLSLLSPLGIGEAAWKTEFPVSWLESEDQNAKAFLTQAKLESENGLIAINPGGNWPSKRWAPERFAEVADELTKTIGAKILVLWGPGERPLAENIARSMTQPAVLSPPTTLKGLGALLSRCRLLISGDSGPLHLAAALGRPTVALFGPSDPDRNGPYGNQARIIRSPVPPATHWQVKERGGHWMEAIAVETVVQAAMDLSALLGERPSVS